MSSATASNRQFSAARPGAAMLDTAPIKAAADLVALAGQTVTLRRVSGANGVEYAGPCPKCGGRDRFHVQGRGLWMCRACHPDWSDAIELLRWRDSMSFPQAVAALGGQMPEPAAAPSHELRQTTPPTDEWLAASAAYLAVTQASLWEDDAARRALDWLRARGLHDDTIRAFRLGFNGDERWAVWGKGRVALEYGITIPRFLPGEDAPRFWNVRRPKGEPKYRAIPGGQMIAFGLGHLQGYPVGFAVEGEFDAMLVYQQAGDLVDVFTVGGAGVKLDSTSAARLLTLDAIFVAYDNDDAGRKGAAAALKWSSRMREASAIPSGNDLTELHSGGGSIRAFVEYHLERLAREQAPKVSAPSPRQALMDLRKRAVAVLVSEGRTPEQAVKDVMDFEEQDLRDFVEGAA